MPMTLPYDMGNAGDLVKHGVLAEFVRWQCELGIPLRFMDPFGGEPWERPVPEVARRVRALKGTALHTAQTDIEDGRYYGSAFVVLHAVGAAGRDDVHVLSGDICQARREHLRACGLSMLDEEFHHRSAGVSGVGYDGYDMFSEIVRGSNVRHHGRITDLYTICYGLWSLLFPFLYPSPRTGLHCTTDAHRGRSTVGTHGRLSLVAGSHRLDSCGF